MEDADIIRALFKQNAAFAKLDLWSWYVTRDLEVVLRADIPERERWEALATHAWQELKRAKYRSILHAPENSGGARSPVIPAAGGINSYEPDTNDVDFWENAFHFGPYSVTHSDDGEVIFDFKSDGRFAFRPNSSGEILGAYRWFHIDPDVWITDVEFSISPEGHVTVLDDMRRPDRPELPKFSSGAVRPRVKRVGSRAHVMGLACYGRALWRKAFSPWRRVWVG